VGRQEETTRDVALVGGRLIDGSGDLPVENATVLVKDGRILAAGPARSVDVPSSFEQIDVSGKTVMPALADMHVHASGGWDGESSDMLGFQRYLNSMLYCGVLTFLDVGNVFPFTIQMRDEIKAGRIPGPRMYTCGPLIDGPDARWFPLTRVVVSLDQIPGAVEQIQAGKVDALKAYQYLPASFVAAIVREGAKYGLPVILDAGRHNGSYDLMRTTGIRAWAHLDSAEPMAPYEMEFMAENNVSQLTTLTVIEYGSLRRLHDLSFLRHPLVRETQPPYVISELTEFAQQAIANPSPRFQSGLGRLSVAMQNAKALDQAGVRLVAGTDAPYPGVFQGEGIHHELELLVEAGLPPVRAIKCATANAASFMGHSDLWGVVAPDRQADLMVVDGNPAITISDTKNIAFIVQAGTILDRSALQYDVARETDFRPVKGIS